MKSKINEINEPSRMSGDGTGSWLCQVKPIVSDLFLQAGGPLVNTPRPNGAPHTILQKRHAVTADGIAADLQKQSVHRIGIKFLWRQVHDFIQRTAERKTLAVRAITGHGVEGVRQTNDAHLHGHIFEKQAVRVARTVAALVVPAHDLRDAWPGKLNPSDNLMPHNGVFRHLAELFGIQRSGFAKQTLVDSHLSDIVQVAGRSQ